MRSIIAALPFAMFVAACSHDSAPTTNIPVAGVVVTPSAESVYVGDTLRLTARAIDGNGAPLAGRSILWSSTDTAIADVSANGLVRARSAGIARVIATSEGHSDSASITAAALTSPPPPPPPPTSPSVIAKVSGDGQTATYGASVAQPLVIKVTDSNGVAKRGVAVTWMAVGSQGVVTPLSVATNASGIASARLAVSNTFFITTVTATVGGHSATFNAYGNGTPSLQARRLFPADNDWNRDVSADPVDALSDAIVASCGATRALHPDFGTVYDGAPNGIPFIVAHGAQAKVPVTFGYADESDPGPYPLPANAPIEGGSSSTGDRHVLVVDWDHWRLYEMFDAHVQNGGRSWTAGSGASFDLASNALRNDGWTSADAAGLPILPGLVRYDEVAAGVIAHALRFTCPRTRKVYVSPARHYASSDTSSALPPMGARLRLKASVDISRFSALNQVILRALKTYGMYVADNGSGFYLSGAPDPRWSDDDLHALSGLHGADFEVVRLGALHP